MEWYLLTVGTSGSVSVCVCVGGETTKSAHQVFLMFGVRLMFCCVCNDGTTSSTSNVCVFPENNSKPVRLSSFLPFFFFAYLLVFSPSPVLSLLESSTAYGCGFITQFVFLPGGYGSLVLLMDTQHGPGEQTRTEPSSCAYGFNMTSLIRPGVVAEPRAVWC